MFWKQQEDVKQMEEDINQMNIFSSSGLPPFKFTKPIKVIELFAGYGSQMMAFEYLGKNAKHFKICEWAAPSIIAYNNIHVRDFTDYSFNKDTGWLVGWLAERGVSIDYNKPATLEQLKRKPEPWIREVYNSIIATKDTVDISRTTGNDFRLENREDYNVFMSYSFPCQDLSLAGKRLGMDENSNTRSSLLWQVGRILEEMNDINQLPDVLMMENVPQVIAGKNVRSFNKWLSKLDDLGYDSYCKILNATEFGIPQSRKRMFVISVKKKYSYEFPKPTNLTKRLKDFIEDDVDRKYYVSNKTIENISRWHTNQNPLKTLDMEICKTITAKSNTALNMNSLFITDKPIPIGSIHETGKNHIHSMAINTEGISYTLTASDNHHPVIIYKDRLTIRQLTPRECFRLMGVRDYDFDKLKNSFKDAQLYHMAGDSIVVNVLMAIFEMLF